MIRFRPALPAMLAAMGLMVGCGGATDQTASSADALSSSHYDQSYSKRVDQGLKISPVPVNTAGKTAEQIRQIGYGSYIVNTSGCADCHSTRAGFLSGGNPFFLDGAGHVVWTRNLTSDPQTGMQLTEAQFLEAMRTGKDFHPNSDGMLIVMPWLYYRWMSDADLKAIYAYLRAVPAVNNFVPPDNKFGMGLPPAIPFPNRYNDGQVDRPLPWIDTPTDVLRGLAIQPLQQPRVALRDLEAYGRGSYIVNAQVGCSECHTNPDRIGPKINTAAYLTGGRVFMDPPPLQPIDHQARSMTADLTGATHGFLNEAGMDEATFDQIMTTNSHADDNPPVPLAWPMSSVAVGKLVPEDLHAVWTYLHHLPANTVADKDVQGTVSWCATSADCGAGQTCAANPATGGNECVGATCSTDADCGACDSCVSGACQPKPPGDACYVAGM